MKKKDQTVGPRQSSKFLGDDYNSKDFKQLKDIVEVWFDSGSTHSFVLEARKDLKWPADMYLEDPISIEAGFILHF